MGSGEKLDHDTYSSSFDCTDDEMRLRQKRAAGSRRIAIDCK